MAKQTLFPKKISIFFNFYSTMYCNVLNNTYLCTMIFRPENHKWRRVLRWKPVRTYKYSYSLWPMLTIQNHKCAKGCSNIVFSFCCDTGLPMPTTSSRISNKPK